MVRGAFAVVAAAAWLMVAGAAPASAASAISVTDVAFGAVVVGTQSTMNITVSNSGDAGFNVSGAVVSGSERFEIIGGTCQPYPKTVVSSCTLQVRFSPTGRGLQSATVTVSNDAAGGDSVASLTGSGVAPVVGFAPTSLSYGGQVVGTSSGAESVAITNDGDANLVISSITKAGTNPGDFAFENNACAFPSLPKQLTPGQSCTLDVRFAPTASGARSASVRVISNAPPTGQDDLPVDGTGTTFGFAFDPVGLAFGEQLVGTAGAARTLTLASTGTADLVISSVGTAGTNAGDFALENKTCLPLPKTVPAGGNCTVDVRFVPTAAGARSAVVHVESSLGGHDAAVSGTGAAPAEAGATGSTDQAGTAPAPVVTQSPIATPVTTAAPVLRCVVPRLRGKTLAAARRALGRAHCRLGRVSRAQSAARPGRVIRQGKRAGRRLPKGSAVAVVLARR